MTFMERNQVTESIAAFARTACVELLEAYSVKLRPGTDAWLRSEERSLSAVIGFVGQELRATCLIAANPGILQSSCPSGCELKDWIGELANQFAGRLKMRLLAHGIEVAMTTPLALSGVRLQPLPRGAFEPIVFVAESGFIVVWVELEATEGFALGPERPNQHQTGELLLF